MYVTDKLLLTNNSSSSGTQQMTDSSFNINRMLHIHPSTFNFAGTYHNEGYNKQYRQSAVN